MTLEKFTELQIIMMIRVQSVPDMLTPTLRVYCNSIGNPMYLAVAPEAGHYMHACRFNKSYKYNKDTHDNLYGPA